MSTDFSLIKSDYTGFISSGGDGTAKIDKKYIVTTSFGDSKKEDSSNIAKPVEGDDKSKNRRRGQNKNRPHYHKDNYDKRLCPSVATKHGTCSFQENCKFLHDIEAYLKIKPEDIGKECITYRRQGICRYSFACRYAQDHTEYQEGKGYVNLVQDEIKSFEMGNTISHELKQSLRKRKFSFADSKATLDHLNKLNAKRKKLSEERVDENKSHIEEKKETKVDENEADLSESSNIKEDNKTPHLGALTDCDLFPLRNCEKKTIDFREKLFLAPLTTCGNLPFRVVCKRQGVDVTCGEMAMSTNLLQAQLSEWALLKRHPCEDIFGIQICGAFPDTMTKCAELINKECEIDFVDINMGCPIDLVYKKGAGSALMRRPKKLFDIVSCMRNVLDIPLTCKMRTGVESRKNTAHEIIPKLRDLGVDLVTIHGRSREARYTKIADWSYVDRCAKYAAPMPLFGNGDVLTQQDYWSVMDNTSISGVMFGRGALIKPWIFTEIKERRDWDISSSERLAILQDFTNEGLMHWGSDTKGVETTRRFLLEWLSFLYRYIPLGLLEQAPQRINERPSKYVGRDDLETLFASNNCEDWVKISEMLLGKVPDTFTFLPKHKANSYK